MAIEQKLSLTQKLEEYDVERERTNNQHIMEKVTIAKTLKLTSTL